MLPILYQSHDFILYSYPLFMGLGWGVAYQIFFALMPENISRYRSQFLFWGLFISAWIGAKILFYLTYPVGESREFIGEVSFWMGGGFVFYGGLLAGALFLLFYKFAYKKMTLEMLWPLIPALSIGHGIGRIGCFLAGCCYGKPTDWFWGVFMHDHYRHPTQLLEAIGLLILGIYLFKSKTSKLLLIGRYFLFYGILRFGIESLRGDDIRGLWGALTPSQWISLLMIVIGINILNKYKALKRV